MKLIFLGFSYEYDKYKEYDLKKNNKKLTFTIGHNLLGFVFMDRLNDESTD